MERKRRELIENLWKRTKDNSIDWSTGGWDSVYTTFKKDDHKTSIITHPKGFVTTDAYKIIVKKYYSDGNLKARNTFIVSKDNDLFEKVHEIRSLSKEREKEDLYDSALEDVKGE